MEGTLARSPDVLVVDDDPTAIASVRATLLEAGYTVVAVESGVDALRAASSLRPRLLILDVQMPGLDGISLCRQLRGHSGTATAPVLFLSSSAATPARVAGLRAGGVDFLSKPFEPQELLARVAAHLEIVSLREALTRRNQTLDAMNNAHLAGVEAASRVQLAMLPREDFADHRVRFAWRCVQCEQLGGDAVNILQVSDDVYAVSILDASGHGVRASLLAVAAGYFVAALAANVLARRQGEAPPGPAAILSDVNRVLCEMVPLGQFVTMLVGIVDLTRSQFTFATAGHPGPLLVRAGQDPGFLDAPAPPAGIRPWEYTDHHLAVRPGDRLVLYSDGVCEQRNAAGEQFGRTRMVQSIPSRAEASAEDTLENIVGEFARWRGERTIEDDISLIAIGFPTVRREAPLDQELGGELLTNQI